MQGDRAARLEQVILNLLYNVIKYTPSVRTEGAYAVLDVVDTGIGIPPSVLPHVCAPQFP